MYCKIFTIAKTAHKSIWNKQKFRWMFIIEPIVIWLELTLTSSNNTAQTISNCFAIQSHRVSDSIDPYQDLHPETPSKTLCMLYLRPTHSIEFPPRRVRLFLGAAINLSNKYKWICHRGRHTSTYTHLHTQWHTFLLFPAHCTYGILLVKFKCGPPPPRPAPVPLPHLPSLSLPTFIVSNLQNNSSNSIAGLSWI